ncbi:DUF930 domain-containing protein [Oricola sp.]|uniref:DUF930 domain-containing protein n=1 Tax=Oricola sp. TaxID=1979950 RepID=UPI003BAC0186
MRQALEPKRPRLGWGVLASVAAHALVFLLLIFGLPLPEFAPDEPETIVVEIVPPPEPEEVAQEEEAEEPTQEQVEEEQLATRPRRRPARPKPKRRRSRRRRSPCLRPVFEFGEENAGPREADDGAASAEAETPAETLPPEPEEPEVGEAALPAEPPDELTEARRLYSQFATGSAAAQVAIAGLPRDMRAGELCATELREQLRRATPPYRPDLLPSYRLPTGTVMEVRRGAFRAAGQWYDLRFRCAIDDGATRVVSFAFDVGAPVPRDQWRSRGFPGF